jgi:hypothetical protein
VRLQLHLPTECLVDDTKVFDAEHGPYTLGPVLLSTRTVQRFGQMTHVSLDIELLRPRQRVVVYELIRIPRGYVPLPNSDRHSRVDRRWRSAPGFFSGLDMYISVWAANAEPQASRVVIAAGRAVSQPELTAFATQLFANVWENRRPFPGLRGRVARWRRWGQSNSRS